MRLYFCVFILVFDHTVVSSNKTAVLGSNRTVVLASAGGVVLESNETAVLSSIGTAVLASNGSVILESNETAVLASKEAKEAVREEIFAGRKVITTHGPVEKRSEISAHPSTDHATSTLKLLDDDGFYKYKKPLGGDCWSAFEITDYDLKDAHEQVFYKSQLCKNTEVTKFFSFLYRSEGDQMFSDVIIYCCTLPLSEGTMDHENRRLNNSLEHIQILKDSSLIFNEAYSDPKGCVELDGTTAGDISLDFTGCLFVLDRNSATRVYTGPRLFNRIDQRGFNERNKDGMLKKALLEFMQDCNNCLMVHSLQEYTLFCCCDSDRRYECAYRGFRETEYGFDIFKSNYGYTTYLWKTVHADRESSLGRNLVPNPYNRFIYSQHQVVYNDVDEISLLNCAVATVNVSKKAKQAFSTDYRRYSLSFRRRIFSKWCVNVTNMTYRKDDSTTPEITTVRYDSSYECEGIEPAMRTRCRLIHPVCLDDVLNERRRGSITVSVKCCCNVMDACNHPGRVVGLNYQELLFGIKQRLCSSFLWSYFYQLGESVYCWRFFDYHTLHEKLIIPDYHDYLPARSRRIMENASNFIHECRIITVLRPGKCHGEFAIPITVIACVCKSDIQSAKYKNYCDKKIRNWPPFSSIDPKCSVGHFSWKSEKSWHEKASRLSRSNNYFYCFNQVEISPRLEIAVTSGELNDKEYKKYLEKYASSNKTLRYAQHNSIVMSLCRTDNKPCNGYNRMKELVAHVVNKTFEAKKEEQRFVKYVQFCGKQRCQTKDGCYLYKNNSADSKPEVGCIENIQKMVNQNKKLAPLMLCSAVEMQRAANNTLCYGLKDLEAVICCCFRECEYHLRSEFRKKYGYF